MKRPYKYWTLTDLQMKLFDQVRIFGYKYTNTEITQMVHSKKWVANMDFNGCNVVQDDLHPFLPCFIHDYRWMTDGRTTKADKEFRSNLLTYGYSTFKAQMYYFAVRVGSVYFKLRAKWQ